MIICKECNESFVACNSLSFHLRKHKIKYIDYIVKHNFNNIWPVCSCGKKLRHKRGKFYKFCTRQCSVSGKNNAMFGKLGKDNPNFGLIRTTEQRKNYSKGSKKRWEKHGEKLRKLMKSESYKQKQSESQKINYQNNSDRRLRISKSINDFWKTDESKLLREKASRRAVILLKENKIGKCSRFKQETIINPWTNEKEFMHSSWELIFFNKCVQNNLKVTKNHNLIIPYEYPKGTKRNYIPDFIDFNNKIIYEIKGRYDNKDKQKTKTAKKFCKLNKFNFIILFSLEEIENYFNI